jgi:hypothetical protein
MAVVQSMKMLNVPTASRASFAPTGPAQTELMGVRPGESQVGCQAASRASFAPTDPAQTELMGVRPGESQVGC